MFHKTCLRMLLFLALLAGMFPPPTTAAARPAQSEVTAYDLIVAMNTLRTSFGHAALIEDATINAVAQATAEIMAANQMSWHIGDVSGRLASAGYGAGAGKVWGTENFAVGNWNIDEIMVVWSDESHMIPAVNPAYCNVGAGVAKSSNGLTYYVLQAAYTSGKSCGEYTSPTGSLVTPGSSNTGGQTGVSQLIVPVNLATPDADGKVIHVVKAGQSFWAIAVAYQITIKDIETWNNLSKDSKLQIGQKLFIPGKNTKGFSTPTPVGMFLVSTPEPDGRVVHTVASYQTLSTIAQAYKIDIATILTLNGLQEDWPLQIGQKLLLHGSNITPSPTPVPLTPLEKLTPESDGKYYHVIESGETLSWIAGLYEVQISALMAWNGLNDSSIIQPKQKLLLEVTPPATATHTPAPATVTPTATDIPPTFTPTRTATLAATVTATAADPAAAGGQSTTALVIAIAMAVGGLLILVGVLTRKKTT